MFDYYFPGFDYKNASDEVYAKKFAMLEKIRMDEGKRRI
jgi:hypothetical protein